MHTEAWSGRSSGGGQPTLEGHYRAQPELKQMDFNAILAPNQDFDFKVSWLKTVVPPQQIPFTNQSRPSAPPPPQVGNEVCGFQGPCTGAAAGQSVCMCLASAQQPAWMSANCINQNDSSKFTCFGPHFEELKQ